MTLSEIWTDVKIAVCIFACALFAEMLFMWAYGIDYVDGATEIIKKLGVL